MATKKTTRTSKGRVLALVRANEGPGWIAVVQQFGSEGTLPILATVVPISSLAGSPRKKADRWLAWLRSDGRRAAS